MSVVLESSRRCTVVVPCFNEERRLNRDAFTELVNAGAVVLFVDDGSTDGTAKVLAELAAAEPMMRVQTLPRNRGKAEAVRAGLLTAIGTGATEVAYLDADLATPCSEMVRLIEVLRSRAEVDAVLGSRVLLLGRDIRRSPMRHYTGRVFATFAAWAVDVPVYDTQCGAKVFRVDERLQRALERPFRSRWAFDVELLRRLLHPAPDAARAVVIEEPLLQWHDAPGSKLSVGSMIRATLDVVWVGLRGRLSGGRSA